MENKENTTAQEPKMPLSFMAIDSYVESHIVAPDEVQARGKDYIMWGKENNYPAYLYGLYKSVSSLHSIIKGSVDYVVGDAVTVKKGLQGDKMNTKGQTPRQLVKALARDYFIHGAFAIQVIRDNAGNIAELYHVPIRNLRSNKDNTVFYYSEDWDKRWGKTNDVVYPAFNPDFKDVPTSILYVKDDDDLETYPECLYIAAVKDCEIERCIDEYHLNEINNGFAASFLVNYNSGIPEDDIKKEIEKSFNKKFAGHKNAGRIVFSWNASKDNMTTLQKLDVQDYGEKYDSLSKHSRQQIFTSFRANPNLFGIPTESNGFNSEEYDSAFKLYNRTQIQPVQKMIVEAFESLYDCGMEIVPFTMGGEGEKTQKKDSKNDKGQEEA